MTLLSRKVPEIQPTGAERPDLHTYIPGHPQTQAHCNLTCFHDVHRAVITMMGKPDSGIARGELRSTLSRAGSCRSS